MSAADELRGRLRDAVRGDIDPAWLPGLEGILDRILAVLAEREPGGAFAPDVARRGLDLLLASAPHLELVEAEWQNGGPWLLVTLGQRSDSSSTDALDVFARHPYAILKATGAVYGMDGPAGPVHDDPFLEPEAPAP